MSKRKSSNEDISKEKKAKSGHWSLGLLDAVKDAAYLIKEDSYTYVIKDKFPKATYHYLVISKEDIPSIRKVKKDNLDLLRHMENVAKEYIENFDKKYVFKIGYHAQPSMSTLHLHVISDDMNSPALKNKKHWNSFTTDFLIPSETIIENLEKNGTISLPSDKQCEEYLKRDLKCNKCEYLPKNMPDLKKHILRHLK